MILLSVLTWPLVWFLSLSTDLILRILGIDASNEPTITEEEINVMLREGAKAGIFNTSEQEMVAGVFRLDNMRADTLMTPRTEMTWLDADDTADVIRQKLIDSDHSRYPLCEGTPDNVLGMVTASDLLSRSLIGGSLDLRTMFHPVPFIPESAPAADILEVFRKEKVEFAMVISEHGDIDGVITLSDILEAVIGDIDEPHAVQREDGSWLIDGLMPIGEFKAQFKIKMLPGEEDKLYQTVAGFIITHIGYIPTAAEHFEWDGLRFEVMDMDGNRVDKILLNLPGTFTPAPDTSPISGE